MATKSYIFTDVEEYLTLGKTVGSPTVFLSTGSQPCWVKDGRHLPLAENAAVLSAEDTERLVLSCTTEAQRARLAAEGVVHFAAHAPSGLYHAYIYQRQDGKLLVLMDMQWGKPAQSDADKLEFKPWVKSTALGLLGAAAFGASFLIFYLGYSQGYSEGTDAVLHSESMDGAAASALAGMLQAGEADDARLMQMAQGVPADLSRPKNARIRQEAEWKVAEELLERHRTEEAVRLLARLLPQTPKTALWAGRARMAAEALLGLQDYVSATAYYRYAADTYAALGLPHEQLDALSGLWATLLGQDRGDEGTAAAMDALLEEVQPLGAAARPLCDAIRLYNGQALREKGLEEDARRCFESILAGLDAEKPQNSVACISRGMAALELGQTELAADLLGKGAEQPADSPAARRCRVYALRGLARLSAAEPGGRTHALAYLSRALGAADGVLDAADSLWPALYDQRGWLFYLNEDSDAALRDFRKALSLTDHPAYRMQPLEGAGRCALEQDRTDEAVNFFSEVVALRREYAPRETLSLGRNLLLLAQAQERRAETPAACRSYAEAVQLLSTATAAEDRENYVAALLGHAAVLENMEDWDAAEQAWQLVQTQAAGRADMTELARTHAHECHSRIPQN